MTAMSLQERVAAKAEQRRWWILFVLCFSLLVIVLDNSILNVAIPHIQKELHASTSQLQWMIDSYTLVFAGLLLTAGSLGDRFGRRPALQLGFAVFGVGSLLAALSSGSDMLIGFRAFMGVGAAFIMPATLSIITNVFPARERGRAIGVWAATAGVAIALGPLTGGALLEHFYWGSVFLVNIPIVLVGLAAGVFLIPNSSDPHGRPLDPIGALLSIAALSTLLYAVIEGPQKGWTAAVTLTCFGVGAALLAGFFAWEHHTAHPMLEWSFFRNPRFSAASAAITLTFFAMFGSLFVMTQYLQLVIGYSPLQTGVRLLAFAIPTMIIAPLSARFVERVGTKVVIAAGLLLFALGLVLLANLDASSDYGDIFWRMVVMAVGIALIMAPSTDSIMGSLPLARAGVGSAVNDTTRQVGGAIGVAVVGSVFASVFSSKIADVFPVARLGAKAVGAAKESLAAALKIAGGNAALHNAANRAFLDGFDAGLYVGAAVLAIGVVAVVLWLPGHPRQADLDRQQAEWEAARASGDGADGQHTASPEHART